MFYVFCFLSFTLSRVCFLEHLYYLFINSMRSCSCSKIKEAFNPFSHLFFVGLGRWKVFLCSCFSYLKKGVFWFWRDHISHILSRGYSWFLGLKAKHLYPPKKSLNVLYSIMFPHRPSSVSSLGFSYNEQQLEFLKELEKALKNVVYCE